MATKQRESETLGVLLVDFSPVIRHGLEAMLAEDSAIKVVEEAPDQNKVVQHIRRVTTGGQRVNVVLTETRNGKIDGVEVTRLVKDAFPDIAVLVLTENPNDSYVIDAIRSGAGGYIFLNDMSPEVLLQSIHRVVQGGTQMTTSLLRAAVENLIQNGRLTLAQRTAQAAHLTEREVDVLRLMGNGDSNKEIAATLGISLDTVKKHVGNIVDKMQAHNRTHAAIVAAQAGIVGKPVTLAIEGESVPS